MATEFSIKPVSKDTVTIKLIMNALYKKNIVETLAT